MNVIKRDGTKVLFDKNKIRSAISRAMKEVNEDNQIVAYRIANEISKINKEELTIEEIQDLVEEKLMNSRLKKTARAYIHYRYDRQKSREISKDLENRYNEFISLIKGTNDEANKENYDLVD